MKTKRRPLNTKYFKSLFALLAGLASTQLIVGCGSESSPQNPSRAETLLPCERSIEDTKNFLKNMGVKDYSTQELANLDILELKDKCPSDEELKNLCPLSKNLKTLAFSNSQCPIEKKLTGTGLKYIAQLSNLVALDLSGNSITADQLQSLRPLKQLESISLSDNRLDQGTGIETLASFSTLRKIILDHNRLGDDRMKEVFAACTGPRPIDLQIRVAANDLTTRMFNELPSCNRRVTLDVANYDYKTSKNEFKISKLSTIDFSNRGGSMSAGIKTINFSGAISIDQYVAREAAWAGFFTSLSAVDLSSPKFESYEFRSDWLRDMAKYCRENHSWIYLNAISFRGWNLNTVDLREIGGISHLVYNLDLRDNPQFRLESKENPRLDFYAPFEVINRVAVDPINLPTTINTALDRSAKIEQADIIKTLSQAFSRPIEILTPMPGDEGIYNPNTHGNSKVLVKIPVGSEEKEFVFGDIKQIWPDHFGVTTSPAH